MLNNIISKFIAFHKNITIDRLKKEYLNNPISIYELTKVLAYNKNYIFTVRSVNKFLNTEYIYYIHSTEHGFDIISEDNSTMKKYNDISFMGLTNYITDIVDIKK